MHILHPSQAIVSRQAGGGGVHVNAHENTR